MKREASASVTVVQMTMNYTTQDKKTNTDNNNRRQMLRPPRKSMYNVVKMNCKQ
jgi:hypothetical protein